MDINTGYNQTYLGINPFSFQHTQENKGPNKITTVIIERTLLLGFTGQGDDNQIHLDGPGGINPNAWDNANAKLDGLNKAMADIFTVMVLIQMMAMEQRKSSREVRETERQMQYSELQGAADKMREAANFALAAAIVSGVFQMAQGAMSITGGTVGLKGLKAGWSESKVMSMGRIFDGMGTALKGTGDIISAGLNRAADEARAMQREAESSAIKHETYAQNENEFMNNLRDLIMDLMKKMQDIQQLNQDSARKAASV